MGISVEHTDSAVGILTSTYEDVGRLRFSVVSKGRFVVELPPRNWSFPSCFCDDAQLLCWELSTLASTVSIVFATMESGCKQLGKFGDALLLDFQE